MAQGVLPPPSVDAPSAPRTGAAGRPVLTACGALACGAGIAAAFPPVGLWPLAPLAVGALAVLARGRSLRAGLGLGLLAGLGLFLPLLAWLRVIGVDAWLALAGLEALLLAPLGAGLALVTRLPAWPIWSAGLWVAAELVRARAPFGGFPWGRLGHAVVDSPLLGWAPLGGAPLVTFVAALAGAAILAVVVGSPRRGRWLGLAAALLVIGALLPALGTLLSALSGASGGSERPVVVAAVQGNVPRLGLDFLGQRRAVLDNHAAATFRLAGEVRAGRAPQPDLVVWPENSSDLDPYRDPDARSRIDAAVRAVGAPTLVGAVVGGPATGPSAGLAHNVGIVWEPSSGPGETYVKRRRVPFGEYLPFRAVLSRIITRFDRVPRDFAAGERPGVLQVGPARIGDVICFEIAEDGVVRDVVRAGGRLLVVQTNNATYGRTGQPEQQLAITRLRAVEHGRAVVVAATSGISALVAPDGRVLDQSEQFVPDLLVGRLPLRDGDTLAARLGAAPEWLLAGAGLVAAGIAARRGGPAR